jgi:Skp family chaperone for outer membrane proteins
MKKGLFLTVLLVLGLVSFVQAQEKPLKIGLINKIALLQAHPDGQKAAGLAQQRDAELQPLVEELQTLQTKSQSAELTAEERSRAQILVSTVEQTRSRYAADIAAAAAPAEEAINTALNAIIDGDLAGLSGLGLFVYVDPASIPDITEQVIAQMNGQ